MCLERNQSTVSINDMNPGCFPPHTQKRALWLHACARQAFQTNTEEEGVGGGQQKAAAAPPEPGQKRRAQRSCVLRNGGAKLESSDLKTQKETWATRSSGHERSFRASRSVSAHSYSCCLGATSQTRWRTRPCHSAARPAHNFCPLLQIPPPCVGLVRFI